MHLRVHPAPGVHECAARQVAVNPVNREAGAFQKGRGQGAAVGAGLLSGPRHRNAAPGPLSKASRTPCRAAPSSAQHHHRTLSNRQNQPQHILHYLCGGHTGRRCLTMAAPRRMNSRLLTPPSAARAETALPTPATTPPLSNSVSAADSVSSGN